MSRALDSLNSILKYKQSREQQKIDRSLSLLDMGNRMQQQKYSREEQVQRMSIAKEAARDANELRDRNLEDYEENKEIIKENQKLTKQRNQFALEQAKEKRFDKMRENLFASIDYKQRQNDANLYTTIKNTPIIPQEVWNYIETKYDGEQKIDEIKKGIKESSENKNRRTVINNFLNKNSSSKILSSLAFTELQYSKSGKRNHDPFLRLFENLSDDPNFFKKGDGIVPFYNNIKPSVEKHNLNKDYYSNAETKASIEVTLKRMASQQIGKELEDVASSIASEEEIPFKQQPNPETLKLMLNMINEETGKNYTRQELGL